MKKRKKSSKRMFLGRSISKTSTNNTSSILKSRRSSFMMFNPDANVVKMDLAKLKLVARLVPSCIVTRFLHDQEILDITSFSEEYEAAVLFADISGFSSLAEKLAKELNSQENAAEDLSSHIGQALEKMIAAVTEKGGDVIKFAGDAILVVFRGANFNNDLLDATLCCVEIAKKVTNLGLRAGDIVLSVHCGVGVGKIIGLNLGGLHGRWEYVITGDPLEQIGKAEPEAGNGEVVLSKEVWEVLKSNSSENKFSLQGKALSSGNFLIENINFKEEKEFESRKNIMEMLDALVNDAAKVRKLQLQLRAYVPRPALIAIDAGNGEWIAELRVCCTVFCKLTGFDFANHRLMQLCIAKIQKQLYKYEGTFCRFIVDDKGAGILMAFGLPPYMHENDATRAILAGLAIEKIISSIKPKKQLATSYIRCSIGVTSGRVFCGTVGGFVRCEYTLHGTIVNLAARLMVAAKQGVLCDEDTYLQAKQKVIFRPPVNLKVKGKQEVVAAYRPVKNKEIDVDLDEELDQLHQFIGRESEIAYIDKLFVQMQTGMRKGGVVFFDGEMGMGKTIMMKYCHREAITKRNVQSLYTKCEDTEKETPFYIFRSMMTQIMTSHYVKCIGQYLYLKREEPEKPAYLGAGQFEFDDSFFLEVEDLKFPCFAYLPGHLKICVLRNIASGLPNETKTFLPSLCALFPEMFEQEENESIEDDKSMRRRSTGSRSYNVQQISDVLFSILELFSKVARKQRRHSLRGGFRSSVKSIFGSDFASGLSSHVVDEKVPFQKATDKPILSRYSTARQSINSSQYSVKGRRKNIDSKSNFLDRQNKNNGSGSGKSFVKADSTKSEPTSIWLDSGSVGGSKENFISGFFRIANSSNMVVLVEDAQFIDTYSLQLVERLLESENQITFMLSRRVDETGTVSYKNLHRNTSMIMSRVERDHLLNSFVLKNFEFEDLAKCLALWLGVAVVDDEVVRLVLKTSNGQPLLSQELMKLLISKRVAFVTEGKCKLVPGAENQAIGLPNSISAIMTAKLDKLKPTHQIFLRKVSVCGVEFSKPEATKLITTRDWRDMNQPMKTDEELSNINTKKNMETILLELCADNFLVPLSNNRFRFASSLLWQSAYNLLLFKDRKVLHMIYADYIEEVNGYYIVGVYRKLAKHYYLASEFKIFDSNVSDKNDVSSTIESKTIKYLELYAQDSLDADNHTEAYTCYTKLLKISKEGYQYRKKLSTAERKLDAARWTYLAGVCLKANDTEDLPKAIELFRQSLDGLHVPLVKRPIFYKQSNQQFFKRHLNDKKVAELSIAAKTFQALGEGLEANNLLDAQFAVDNALSIALMLQRNNISSITDDLAHILGQSCILYLRLNKKFKKKSSNYAKLCETYLEKVQNVRTKVKLTILLARYRIFSGQQEKAEEHLNKGRWICKFAGLSGFERKMIWFQRVYNFMYGRINSCLVIAKELEKRYPEKRHTYASGLYSALLGDSFEAEITLVKTLRLSATSLKIEGGLIKAFDKVSSINDPFLNLLAACFFSRVRNLHFLGIWLCLISLQDMLTETRQASLQNSMFCTKSLILLYEFVQNVDLPASTLKECLFIRKMVFPQSRVTPIEDNMGEGIEGVTKSIKSKVSRKLILDLFRRGLMNIEKFGKMFSPFEPIILFLHSLLNVLESRGKNTIKKGFERSISSATTAGNNYLEALGLYYLIQHKQENIGENVERCVAAFEKCSSTGVEMFEVLELKRKYS
eukprot:snap_masked-scaffold_17-processed-gene-4.26-mRNA-1 protein AED:0.73 eAED:0.73 QI:0/-1/0/1/-1/1/1/0/1727